MGKDQRVRRVARQMLDEKVCEPFDIPASTWLATGEGNASNDERDGFSIPGSAVYTPEMGCDYVKLFTCWAFAVARESFRPGSWPEIVSREAFMTECGCGESAATELKKVYQSEKSGPLCFLVAGALFETLNPPMARLLTSRGLERLSAADFRKEYSVLFDPQYPIGQCARRMAALLGKLDEPDVQSLGALLPEKSAAAFRQWVQGLRRGPKQPVDQAMPALLDALWQSGLRASVKTALETLQCYAGAYLQQGGMDKAIADAAQTLRLDAEAVETYKIRAWAYEWKGEDDKAIADYTKAIRLNPKDVTAYYARGSVYYRKAERDKAMADNQTQRHGNTLAFEQTFDQGNAAATLKDRPSNSLVPNGWRVIYENDFDNAIADYTEAIRLDPKLGEAYHYRGLLYQAKGDHRQAEADMAEAKRLTTKL
jgi:tetratricopeptide (TPR) repeat protein